MQNNVCFKFKIHFKKIMILIFSYSLQKRISSPTEVRAIILAMMNDQREHTFSAMTDVYLKVIAGVKFVAMTFSILFNLHICS